MKKTMCPHAIERYVNKLRKDERALATLEKYRRDIYAFYVFLPADKKITKEEMIRYKRHLADKGYAVTSINSMLVAVNGFLSYLGAEDCKVKLFKQQRRSFCDQEKELSREEYLRLVNVAQKAGNIRLALILQTICSTGIRVSELQYITVQSLKKQEAQVQSKGKVRKILIPQILCARLIKYCADQAIREGSIFMSRQGKPISRSCIWAAMKRLCAVAGISAAKVFPHNLRHLFARIFYKQHKDIVRLADVLGHSSVDTTRIYTLTSGVEQLGQLARMRLLL